MLIYNYDEFHFESRRPPRSRSWLQDCSFHVFDQYSLYDCAACVSTRVMSCLPVFFQSGQDCFLLGCEVGYKEIVHELLMKDKVDQNVVDEVRN